MPASDENTAFTITLPNEAVETMMDLLPCKLYGSNRAEIAKSLILDSLKKLAEQGFVEPRKRVTSKDP